MAQRSKPRPQLNRALHAEAAKRGLDHEDLRDIFHSRFELRSMSDASIDQLQQVYKGLTGRYFRTRKKKPPLPVRGTASGGDLVMVAPAHLETLARAFQLRGWGKKTQQDFIRRQLRGRDVIRTERDFQRVFRGVQAMNRRDGLERQIGRDSQAVSA